MEGAAGALGEAGDVIDAEAEVAADFGELFFAADEFLERTGERADAAFDALGHEVGDQVEEAVGVVEALAGGPVGGIDLFFHAPAVEAAVGKSINGENVAAAVIKPVAEGGERGGFAEFARGLVAEAQADGKGCGRADALFDGEGEAVEGVEGLRPVLAAVDVGAVGQMQAVVELHTMGEEDGESSKLKA